MIFCARAKSWWKLNLHLITTSRKVMEITSLLVERQCYGRRNLVHSFPLHSGPENLKKATQKNSWNQINQNFFLHQIVFLVVLNFFPVQKLIFGHFRNCKKWNLVNKKFCEIDLFVFTSFFWPALFLNFLAYCDTIL